MSRRGDAFTKLLRRRILQRKREARECDRADSAELARNGCSDYYDQSQRLWACVFELEAILETYIQFKGY